MSRSNSTRAQQKNPPTVAPLPQLTRHIGIASKALAGNFTRVSILVSGEFENTRYNEILVWDHTTPIPIPLDELLQFFQNYGDLLASQKMISPLNIVP